MANITGCRGADTAVTLPRSLLSVTLPRGYEPTEFPDGAVMIFLHALRCEKLAVRGADEGGVSFDFLLLPVDVPPEAKAEKGYVTAWLLNASSNSSFFRSFLSNLSVPVGETSLWVEAREMPIFYKLSHGFVNASGFAQYEFRFAASLATRTKSEKIDLFYFAGTDVGRLRANNTRTTATSEDGGELSAAPNSPLSRAASGLQQFHAFGERIEEENLEIRPR